MFCDNRQKTAVPGTHRIRQRATQGSTCRTFSTHDSCYLCSSPGKTTLLDPSKRHAVPSVLLFDANVSVGFDIECVEGTHLHMLVLHDYSPRY